MKKLFKQAKKGFTIVELVIVIGVIGILSAVLIPTFVNLNEKASAAALQQDLTQAYAQYIADAADGKVESYTDYLNYEVKMYAEKDVAIQKGETVYVRGTTVNEWVVATPEKAGVITVPGETVTYVPYVVGDYSVYHK